MLNLTFTAIGTTSTTNNYYQERQTINIAFATAIAASTGMVLPLPLLEIHSCYIMVYLETPDYEGPQSHQVHCVENSLWYFDYL